MLKKITAKFALAVLVLSGLSACNGEKAPQLFARAYISEHSDQRFLKCSVREVGNDDLLRYQTIKDPRLDLSTENRTVWAGESYGVKSAVNEFNVKVFGDKSDSVNLASKQSVTVLEAQEFLISALVNFHRQILNSPDYRNRLLVVLPEVLPQVEIYDHDPSQYSELSERFQSNNQRIKEEFERLIPLKDQIDMIRIAGGDRWLDHSSLLDFGGKAKLILLSSSGQCE